MMMTIAGRRLLQVCPVRTMRSLSYSAAILFRIDIGAGIVDSGKLVVQPFDSHHDGEDQSLHLYALTLLECALQVIEGHVGEGVEVLCVVHTNVPFSLISYVQSDSSKQFTSGTDALAGNTHILGRPY